MLLSTFRVRRDCLIKIDRDYKNSLRYQKRVLKKFLENESLTKPSGFRQNFGKAGTAGRFPSRKQ